MAIPEHFYGALERIRKERTELLKKLDGEIGKLNSAIERQQEHDITPDETRELRQIRDASEQELGDFESQLQAGYDAEDRLEQYIERTKGLEDKKIEQAIDDLPERKEMRQDRSESFSRAQEHAQKQEEITKKRSM